MDNRLHFDVYVTLSDPSIQVLHDVYDDRVSIIAGKPVSKEPENLLQIWFCDPETVVDLGRRLIGAGARLAAHRARKSSAKTGDGAEPLPATNACRTSPEEYPVPIISQSDFGLPAVGESPEESGLGK